MPSANAQSKFGIRFSLRTLCILFTIASVWMGLKAKWAREQEQATEWIVANGGTVEYSSAFEAPIYLKPKSAQDRTEPNWFVRRIGIHYVEYPVFVHLNNVELDNVALDHLTCLSKLRLLWMANVSIEASALDRLHDALPYAHIVHRDGLFLGLGDTALSPYQCVISVVDNSSPAEKAGVLVGDTILELAGQRVRNFGDLRRILSRCKSEGMISLRVIRAGERLTLNVPIEKWQDQYATQGGTDSPPD